MPTRSTKTWRRPLSTIYNNNYKFGNSLYSDTLQSIEKKYQDSLSRTHLRSDRPDLNLSTFSSSSLTAGPITNGVTSTSSSRPSVLGSSTSETTKITSSTTQSILQQQDLDTEDLEKKKEEQQRSFESFEARLNSVLRTALGDDEEPPKEFRRARSLTEFDTVDTSTIKRNRQRSSASEDRWEPPTSRIYSSTLANVPEIPEEEPLQEETTLRKRRRQPPPPEPEAETFDKTQFMSKCRDLQSQIDTLNRTVSDVEQRIKGEVTGTKNKIQTELSDLSTSLEDSSSQATDLQKIIKKQTNQLAELQSNYDEVQRSLQDATDQLGVTQRRCQSLKDELSSLRATVEQAGQTKTSKTSSRRF